MTFDFNFFVDLVASSRTSTLLALVFLSDLARPCHHMRRAQHDETETTNTASKSAPARPSNLAHSPDQP